MAILVFLPMLCLAQVNLVPNPSFEQHTECPTSAGQWWKVLSWGNANGSSPDFFHVCGPPDISPPDTFPRLGVPENQFGYQQPVSGEAYMGLYGVQLGNQEWREYVQVELTEPLHFRIRYVVSFHVSLCEASRYAISTLGAYLSEDAISSNDLLVLDAVPQILPDPLQPITDTINWVLVTDTFRSPHGGERFITIGNFFSDAESDTTFVNPNAELGALHAYYYIDDVSVIALDSVPSGKEEQEELGFDVYPNPTREVLRFRVLDSSARSLRQAQGRRSVGMIVRVLDAVGRELLCQSSPPEKEGLGEVDISPLPKGIYFLELTNKEGQRAVRRFVKE